MIMTVFVLVIVVSVMSVGILMVSVQVEHSQHLASHGFTQSFMLSSLMSLLLFRFMVHRGVAVSIA